jgi:alcohol dehydrogenase (cytochrome c)/quinohemoprotein ethanol dehydrogenase
MALDSVLLVVRAVTALIFCFVICFAAGALEPARAAESAANVDAARLVAADQDPANWMTYGRTYSEQRFSPLTQINADNVHSLGLAGFADFDADRGQEATPLVIDGVLYVSTAWSNVRAFDAKTARQLWFFDAQVPRPLAYKGCCDAVNRGVAAWKGKIFVGTLDGRLVAIDAKTGQEVWSVVTVDQARDKAYTITGAARVVKGKVLIGVSGGEYGMRGYFSAYDAETGALAWRFYTVPGDPSKGFENDAMAMAAKTWHGEWWKYGGGGTTWVSTSYDPELNLIYFGTGNAAVWNQLWRSENQGDNLFTASIIAVNADTGAYVWHYQCTPGDEWDFDAVQDLVLADLTIDGTKRQVLMHANKNGFFYVLDRKTGQLISANNFMPTTWASGVDLKTGRPIEAPGARYSTGEPGKPHRQFPAALGAHNWQAMAFNPQTGLVYIPANGYGLDYVGLPPADFKLVPSFWNLGVLPIPLPTTSGSLLAWDPVKQKEAWHFDYPGLWNGGILTTAGNLVVQGNATGALAAFRADTGQKLWSMSTQSAVMAAPITYQVDGEQYIAVLAGWGGGFSFFGGKAVDQSGNIRPIPRLLVYKLGASVSLPPVPPLWQHTPPIPPDTADAATLKKGFGLYAQFCLPCHGAGAVAGGVVPDLRKSSFLPVDAFHSIVLDGLLKSNGMPDLGFILDRPEVDAIKAYIIHQAHEDNIVSSEAPPRPPDSNRGAVIAAQGTPAGAPACARCHAYNGGGDGSGAFPRIAGLPAFYMAEQLHDFRSGIRRNAIMSPVAQALSEDDISDVTAYFAAAVAPFMPLTDTVSPALIAQGERLANIGNAAKGIPGCLNCHGPDGAGQSPTIPYLGGQYGHYISFELKMWQRGFRDTSHPVMRLFANKLDDQEVAALAAYYEQLRPPAK